MKVDAVDHSINATHGAIQDHVARMINLLHYIYKSSLTCRRCSSSALILHSSSLRIHIISFDSTLQSPVFSMQSAPVQYDYTHPERHHKGLVFAPDGKVPPEARAQREGLLVQGCRYENEELCWACGWSADNELQSCYGPRVKIFHTRDNIGVWAIGSQWLLRDQPNDGSQGNEYMTQRFLRQQPNLTIPLVKEMHRLSQPTDQIHFTLFSRAQGDTLDSVWNTLTPQQKSGYIKQLAGHIQQLQQFTAPVAMKVDGSRLDDVFIGYCVRRHPPTCKKIGFTTEEWFENITEELRRGLSVLHKTDDEVVIEAKLQELRDKMPSGEPYTLTHGDLRLANILVKDDKIEAIVDWEFAGYYSWWAERWLSLINNDQGVNELFDPIWAELHPHMDEDTFQTEIFDKLYDIIIAWRRCPKDHPRQRDSWRRPGFCKCRPYAGTFDWMDIGNQLGHRILGPDEVKPAESVWKVVADILEKNRV